MLNYLAWVRELPCIRGPPLTVNGKKGRAVAIHIVLNTKFVYETQYGKILVTGGMLSVVRMHWLSAVQSSWLRDMLGSVRAGLLASVCICYQHDRSV